MGGQCCLLVRPSAFLPQAGGLLLDSRASPGSQPGWGTLDGKRLRLPLGSGCQTKLASEHNIPGKQTFLESRGTGRSSATSPNFHSRPRQQHAGGSAWGLGPTEAARNKSLLAAVLRRMVAPPSSSSSFPSAHYLDSPSETGPRVMGWARPTAQQSTRQHCSMEGCGEQVSWKGHTQTGSGPVQTSGYTHPLPTATTSILP